VVAHQHSDLTIGIPVGRFWENGLIKARELRASGFLGFILVSTHSCPDLSPEDHRRIELESKNLNLRVLVSEEPLSLYENFYKLVRFCETSFFCWVALDDWPSLELVNSETPLGDFDLVVTDVVIKEFNLGEFGGTISEHKAGEFFECNQFVIHPFYIFGVWSRDFLLKIWPSSEFDYLDTFLLYKTRFEGRVKVLTSSKPSWIGYQDKKPHSVTEKGHSMWIWATKVLTSKTFWSNWGGNRSFANVAYSHFRFCRLSRIQARI
jgi:hypothetical protein